MAIRSACKAMAGSLCPLLVGLPRAATSARRGGRCIFSRRGGWNMLEPLEFDPQISGNLGKLGLEHDLPLDDRHFLAVFSHLLGKWSSPLSPALEQKRSGWTSLPAFQCQVYPPISAMMKLSFVGVHNLVTCSRGSRGMAPKPLLKLVVDGRAAVGHGKKGFPRPFHLVQL